MPGKIILKRKIAAVLASGNVGSHALILDEQDVVLLLRVASCTEIRALLQNVMASIALI